jgi:acetyltransferase-like isoleucine patch superfamily enzyme
MRVVIANVAARLGLLPRLMNLYAFRKLLGDRGRIHAWELLGRNCILNDEIKLLTGSHLLDSPTFEGFAKPIELGDYVWLPHRILVMPGVSVGHHAVIGSGSTVTHDVPPFAIVAGSPARVVGERPRHEYTYVPTNL